MPLATRAITVVVLPFALGACDSLRPPDPASISARSGDVPAAIAAPSGATLALTLKGSGLQNYECRTKADAAGGYDWVLVSPEAVLRDQADGVVGRHYAGPTWEYGDGSKVTGKVLATVPAPQAGNLPWLLLQGTAAATPGALAGVTHVQRVDTVGGVAPSDSCSGALAGARQAVRYSADYVFYRR